jgi:hypothetical protein
MVTADVVLDAMHLEEVELCVAEVGLVMAHRLSFWSLDPILFEYPL